MLNSTRFYKVDPETQESQLTFTFYLDQDTVEHQFTLRNLFFDSHKAHHGRFISATLLYEDKAITKAWINKDGLLIFGSTECMDKLRERLKGFDLNKLITNLFENYIKLLSKGVHNLYTLLCSSIENLSHLHSNQTLCEAP